MENKILKTIAAPELVQTKQSSETASALISRHSLRNSKIRRNNHDIRK